MTTTPSPSDKPARPAKVLKFLGRSMVALGLLSLGNHYVPVIDGVTAATQVISSPPLLALISNRADLGNNGTVTVTEGQNLTISVQGGDPYGYPVQVQIASGMPPGGQTNPANGYNYGINPVMYFGWTPAIGTAASNPVSQLSFLSHNYYNGLTTVKSVTVRVAKWSPSTTNINCLFNWAETAFPSLLTPTGFPTAVAGVYTYRWYSATNSYVGVSSADNHVYFLGSDGQMIDEGAITDWLPKAGC